MADEVVAVAVIEPAEGQREAVREALVDAVPEVHGEPGCVRYALHEADDGSFVMLERWASQDALQAHAEGPGFRLLSERLEGRLARALDVTVVRPLPAGDPVKGVI